MTTAYPAPHYPRYDAVRPLPPRRPLNAADAATGVVLYVLALVLAACSAYATVFFAFAADSCSGRSCDFVGEGMFTSWGGAALGVALGAVALPIAAWRRRLMWVWGALSLVLVVGGFLLGFEIVSTGMAA